MPLVKSYFNPIFVFKNAFISTVYSGLFRQLNIKQKRERIILRDGDFLDLDWSYTAGQSNKLVILLHGMEGDGQRPYVTGVAKHFNSNGIDAVCVNFRSCSGELNKKFSSFHSGQTDDIKDVIAHVIKTYNYTSIFLKGISLGGNIILKYLGENDNIPQQLKAAMAVSVPVDLAASSKALHQFKNILFHIYFMIGLKYKLMKKQRQFPDKISRKALYSVWTLRTLDEVYTAKANGFTNAADYYEKSSSLGFLSSIKTPVLLLNAKNDSFLTPSCFPLEMAQKSKYLHLETPEKGGHVGFIQKGCVYYNEKRALEFFRKFQ
ncbi:MAG: YheT family hydrolase [Flavobacteriaceae bacterium]|jgi:predicted alpha/beta-fold hydrolase|nr:alpha/beta fold hydrolase [Flavobacteriaceae bacterium]